MKAYATVFTFTTVCLPARCWAKCSSCHIRTSTSLWQECNPSHLSFYPSQLIHGITFQERRSLPPLTVLWLWLFTGLPHGKHYFQRPRLQNAGFRQAGRIELPEAGIHTTW